MRTQLLAFALLVLAGCGTQKQAPRSLIGDGNNPSAPVARDETVAIGYKMQSPYNGTIMITVFPNGLVTYGKSGAASAMGKYNVQKNLKIDSLTQVRRGLSLFRPPEVESSNKDSIMLPVGCRWEYDMSDVATMVFTRAGQSSRWLHIPTNCKTAASLRLLREMSSIINGALQVSARSGLSFTVK